MKSYRQKIRLLNQQYNYFAKQEGSAKNNLLDILDQTYPDARVLFDSYEPAKFIEIVSRYWHADKVIGSGWDEFQENYQTWCAKHSIPFDVQEARRIFDGSKNKNPPLPKDVLSQSLVRDALTHYNHASKTAAQYKKDLCGMVMLLPEYYTVMSLLGKESFLGVQLIAYIGDVRRFQQFDSLVSYSNLVGDKQDSSKTEPKLKKALMDVAEEVLKRNQGSDPLYRYMKTKFNEGKPYFNVLVAGGHMFLKKYYQQVKECLNNLDAY